MTPAPTDPPQSNLLLDPTASAGMVARMLGKLVKNAMRSSVQELITPQLEEMRRDIRELKDGQKGLQTGLARLDGRIDALGGRLDTRIDETNQQVAALGARLDTRIAELALQQGRMVEEVAALKREKEATGDIVHRLTRIEDRLFAHAV